MEPELNTPNPPAKAPVKKAPAKRKRVKRAVARTRPSPPPLMAAAAPDPLEGITQSDCPFECDPERCAITGANVCGHPHKGGLQSAFLSQTEIVRRYNHARRLIARQITDRKI